MHKIIISLICVVAIMTSVATATVVAEDAAITAVKSYIAKQTEAGKLNKEGAWKSRLPRFPSLSYTKGSTYVWKLKTNLGEMELEFLPGVAPNHVSNFIYLTELGFFDGLGFHRVIPGFMAQGGCPQGSGRGNPGYKFAGEYSSSVKHTQGGLLSMANAGPGTDGSQFFITFKQTPWLDGKHTIFGKLRAGDEILKEIEKCGSPSGRPSKSLTIEKATVSVESKASPKKPVNKKPAEKKPAAKPKKEGTR